MIEDIKTKIENGETLTSEEQSELVNAVNSDFEQLRKDKPEEYLALIKKVNEILTGLNDTVIKATEELKK